MHQVAGMWIPEGSEPGQSSVTVTHLSLFAPLSSLGSKIANGLCLKQNPLDFLNCLVGKGIGYVDKQIVQALLGKAVNACEARLLAQADSGSTAGVLIGTLKSIFTGPCVGQAGEGDWAPPVTSSPTLSSNGGPIQGGTVPIQGGSPPLQGGPTPTQPAPGTAPVPAGSGRILISPCLNLRSGPNGNTTLIGCVPQNTIISIDCTAQGDSVTGPYGPTTLWDHTTYNGVAGYVSDGYVYTGKSGAVAGTCATPAAPATLPTARILISPCLNLRSGPNGNTTLIGCVPQNTIISIDCTAQGDSVTGPYGATTLWDHTTYNGVAGYVSDAYAYTGKSGAVAGTC